MLARGDATRRETLAVADAIDVIDDWNFWIARQQEVRMHRVRRAAGIDSADRRDESLPDNLTTKDPLPADLRQAAEEQVHFERFEVEDIEQILYGGQHEEARMVKGYPQPAMLQLDLQGMHDE